ncbi:MAG: DUF4932 domain-containing protein [Planctomycetes bacterium]|nr:DUF4932 domain-containing protein [Planctomycetota bacterium]
MSGCRDAFETIGHLHKELCHDMRFLEIGCGIGRILQFFSVMFASLLAMSTELDTRSVIVRAIASPADATDPRAPRAEAGADPSQARCHPVRRDARSVMGPRLADALVARLAPRGVTRTIACGLAALLGPALAAQAPSPTTAAAVHEPLELLCVAARFAGFEEYQPHRSDPAYGRDVAAHFARGKDHALVGRLRALRQRHGIGYDAIAGLAVHLGPLPELTPRTPLALRPAMLDARWNGADPDGVRALLRDFAQATDAAAFFAGKRAFFAEAERRLALRLADSKALPWFDEFFGARAGASCIAVVGLQCGDHNYGVSVQHADGAPDALRPVFGCWRFDGDGVPEFGPELLPLFVHELCHSYTNPVVDRSLARLQDAGDQLFAAKATAMRRQAYANGRTVLCETFVRACVIRCLRDTEGEAAARKQAAQEARNHFPWAAEIAALLGAYQQDRAQYPTFDAFVPRIADALDAIATKLAADAAKAPQLVAMTPSNGATDVDPATTTLVFTFDRPMRDQSWSVVGSKADTPTIPGKPAYDAARTVLTLPVQLAPGRVYRFGLNSADKQGFQGEDGTPLAPVEVTFATRGK